MCSRQRLFWLVVVQTRSCRRQMGRTMRHPDWLRRAAPSRHRRGPCLVFITVGRARKPRSSADQRARGSFPPETGWPVPHMSGLKYRIPGPRIPTFRDWQARLILAYEALVRRSVSSASEGRQAWRGFGNRERGRDTPTRRKRRKEDFGMTDSPASPLRDEVEIPADLVQAARDRVVRSVWESATVGVSLARRSRQAVYDLVAHARRFPGDLRQRAEGVLGDLEARRSRLRVSVEEQTASVVATFVKRLGVASRDEIVDLRGRITKAQERVDTLGPLRSASIQQPTGVVSETSV